MGHGLVSLTARIQALQGQPPKDHTPQLLELRRCKDGLDTTRPKRQHWLDKNAMMEAIRCWGHQVDFLQGVESSLIENYAHQQALLRKSSQDRTFEAVEQLLRTAGPQLFARAPGRRAGWSDRRAERRRLLEERAHLRRVRVLSTPVLVPDTAGTVRP